VSATRAPWDSRLGQPLTWTQLRVLELTSHGFSALQVARLLFVTVDTVKTHKRHVLKRLGARNGAHAVRLGFERGLLSTEPSPTAPDVADRVSVPEFELDDELDDER
jgi:DNA-binding NarL/FixJ family response regulator